MTVEEWMAEQRAVGNLIEDCLFQAILTKRACLKVRTRKHKQLSAADYMGMLDLAPQCKFCRHGKENST
jgi:hypothetical protein